MEVKKNEPNLLPNITVKKQNSETLKDKSNNSSGNSFLTTGIKGSVSNNSNNNSNTSKTSNVLNSPSFSQLYFSDKSKTDTKITIKSAFQDLNQNSDKQSNPNGFSNYSRFYMDQIKETPKPLPNESTPTSSKQDSKEEKDKYKITDSPTKKNTDMLYNNYSNNTNTIKLMSANSNLDLRSNIGNNSNASFTTSSLSQLEKVHLTSIGLSNLGNTCFM